jgi:glycine/D-amino acid oxidase-like deaminating enzyme
MNWWREMRDEEPELFQDVDLVLGVARVYDNAGLFEAAKALHEKYGGLAKHHGALSANDPDDLEIIKDHYPHFHAAIRSGFIRGGVLHMDEEKSFTFNVQKFGENLINHLERAGVQLQFNTDMRSIKTNDEGDVVALYGVRTDGDVSYLYNVTGTNIIVSAGAYAGKLLEGTPVEHAINGVAGGWIVLPAPDGIQKSFKVHGDRYFISDDGAILRYDTLNRTEREALPPQTLRSVSDQNHKIIERDGKSYIVIGGGYAWVGSDPHSISKAQKETMKEENLRVARAVYGDHFDIAMAKGEVECWDNICVRSFSANDVPIFSLGKTESGGRFVVIGGMNTGTTTAAPMTGTIVADLIDKSEGIPGSPQNPKLLV